MKKLVNTGFLGSCFILAILLEIYSIQTWEGDIFSAVALGVVVLITGFLFMDSVKNKFEQRSKDIRFYMEQVMISESEKWNDKYNEIVNLQKASYTAIKKNSISSNDQFNEVLKRLDQMEKKNAIALQSIKELQKASLEGQKKALNLQISYNNENTKKILEHLQQYENKSDVGEQISKAIELIEHNHSILLEQVGNLAKAERQIEINTIESNVKEEISQDFYDELDSVDHVEDEFLMEEKAPEDDWSDNSDEDSEAVNPVDEIAKSEKSNIIPLYDDPNKALSTDEIAALFASYGQ